MKPDKKQIPQLILLGLLVLACIGYISFTVTKSGRQAPLPTEAQQAVNDATGEDEAQATPESARVFAMGVFPSLTSPPETRDPFVPQITPGKDEPAAAVRPSPQPPKPPVSMASVPPFNPFQAMQPNKVSVEAEVVPPDPQFTLTGVISGEKNIAIIRSEDGGRYIVQQGQIINGRYKVLSVSEDGAVLADKNHRIHVKLGGVKNAS